MIQKISENLLKTIKATKTLLESFISKTQITQSQRIHHLGEKKISQERISGREIREIHR